MAPAIGRVALLHGWGQAQVTVMCQQSVSRTLPGWIRLSLALAVVQVLWLILVAPVWAQERGYLGVFIQNLPRTFEAGGAAIREGVVILGLMRHSPAEKAGLQRGDILLKFNDQPVHQVENLQGLVSDVAVGEVAQLEIFRRNEILTLPVRIEAAPEAPRTPPSNVLPALLERDETIWIIVGGASLALLLVYLSSAQPWRRWSMTRAAAMFEQTRPVTISAYKILIAVAGVLTVILVWSSLVWIEAGHRGVVFRVVSGVQERTLDEGVHLVLPILNRVSVYDMRSRIYHVRDLKTLNTLQTRKADQAQDHLLWTPTGDGLKVGLDLSVRYRLDPSRLAELHRTVGPEFEQKVVHPIVWNVTRLVASEYSLLDVYGKRRHDMQEQSLSRIQALFARDGLVAEDLFLREIVYTKEFEKTLVAKMVAEQKVQESIFEVQQAELYAQVQVLEAQGEARALDIINQAIRDHPMLLQYLWIRSLPEHVKIMVVPNRSGGSVPVFRPEPPESQQALTAPGGDG